MKGDEKRHGEDGDRRRSFTNENRQMRKRKEKDTNMHLAIIKRLRHGTWDGLDGRMIGSGRLVDGTTL